MFAKDREAMRLTPAEVRLILIESLQWCANNAVYFLGLIGAATYDLAGTAFLVAAITLVRNLMTSVGNMVSGSVIDRFGPRRTSFVTCVITAVLSLGVGLAPLSVPGLVFAACVLGLAGGFINTCTHAFPGYLESTTEGRTRVNGLMVFYSNIAYTAGPLLGGAIVSCFATQSVYLLMAGMMGVAAVLSLGCHECVAPAKGEKPKGGILGGMAEGARLTPHLYLGLFGFLCVWCVRFAGVVVLSRCAQRGYRLAGLVVLGRGPHFLGGRVHPDQASCSPCQPAIVARRAHGRGHWVHGVRGHRYAGGRNYRSGD